MKIQLFLLNFYFVGYWIQHGYQQAFRSEMTIWGCTPTLLLASGKHCCCAVHYRLGGTLTNRYPVETKRKKRKKKKKRKYWSSRQASVSTGCWLSGARRIFTVFFPTMLSVCSVFHGLLLLRGVFLTQLQFFPVVGCSIANSSYLTESCSPDNANA